MVNEKFDILLVEDSLEEIELTLHALRHNQNANCTHVAHDGEEEAMVFLFCRRDYAGRSFESPPKVTLRDLKLPMVDELEVLGQVKSDPRTKPIPIIIFTVSREEKDWVNGYHLGVNVNIQKPVDFDQFRETVKRSGLHWLVVNQPPSPAAFRAES